jgi:uracil-DNA glycosylase family 4
MDEHLRKQYLFNMGIVVWEHKQSSVPSIAEQTHILDAEHLSVNELTWQQLQDRVQKCQLCSLHQTRIQTVFGVGNPQADLVIVGEAPGANEDRQGKPFVGRAGKLLDEMLKAISFDRTTVYICNVLKCRPPMNRDPSPGEVNCCTPYLERQLALLNPKLILAVGRVAAHHLLGIDHPMHRLRGQRFEFGPLKIPLLVTYHPAYLLRNPKDKSKAYQDLLKTQQQLMAACEG